MGRIVGIRRDGKGSRRRYGTVCVRSPSVSVQITIAE